MPAAISIDDPAEDMNEFLERVARLSPERLASLAAEQETELRRLSTIERRVREPIAIIGIGCRFPGGADSPEAFWRLLSQRFDAIRETPADRWDVDALYDPDPDRAGTVATRWGGFLDDVAHFDAPLFGISRREAEAMDPQQRIALEVAWEALERAGQPPDRLDGSATGVFLGVLGNDYFSLALRGELADLDTYSATGNANSVASGRISYVLGLRGPCVSVDTACSSSLVAVHLAVQSLRMGECDMALAGGVNLILAPDVTIALSRAHMMAPDGRCKAFDAAANGFVRSEGCGIVVLKRLSDAVAAGDPVVAVIRGSAINQDGRSSGITAPNGPSQESVIRAALANAGLEPADVDYVEAHGTGTELGDPIEVQALAATLGRHRPPDRPLVIGSVKANIGHAEAAAGIAGLIKAALVLQHGEAPPQPHYRTPNPHIAWKGSGITVAGDRTRLTAPDRPLRAGVSSFGFSGTNAHVVLEAVDAVARSAPPPPARPMLLKLAGRTEAALRALAGRYADHLANTDVDPADFCASANRGRADLDHRAAILAANGAELRDALDALARGEPAPGAITGRTAGAGAPEVAFLFTGQGAQYAGMARELYETEPRFRAAMDRCDALFREHLDHGVLEAIGPRGGATSEAPLLDRTDITQAALFAVEYALAELWRSWGIEPAAVLGHSLGEYVAATVAGLLPLEDAIALVATRGRLMQALPPGGAMLAAFIDEQEATRLARIAPGMVSIAAVNGPESVVLSGDVAAIEWIATELSRVGVESRRLRISNAFHSPLVEPIVPEFRRAAARVRFAEPAIAIVSNVTGRIEGAALLASPDYWVRHAREPVRFADATRTLYDEGFRYFLEVGPKPTLIGLAQAMLPGDDCVWLTSLRPDHGDVATMRESLARLYVSGANVNWGAVDPDRRRWAPVPTYPFQRERHWRPISRSGVAANPTLAPPAVRRQHPLLGARLTLPVPEVVFATRLRADALPYLRDHTIMGRLLVPAPLLLELAQAGGAEVFRGDDVAIEDFVVREPLALPASGGRTVHLVLESDGPGRATFRISAIDAGGDADEAVVLDAAAPFAPETAWRTIAEGRVSRLPARTAGASTASTEAPHHRFDPTTIQARCSGEIPGETFYARIHSLGLEFGPAFRGVTRVWAGESEALALVRLPDTLRASAERYRLHPAMLDACLHTLGAPETVADRDSAYMMTAVDRIAVHRQRLTDAWAWVEIRPARSADDATNSFTADVRLLALDGTLAAELEGVHLRRASHESLRPDDLRVPADWLYELTWVEDDVAQPNTGESSPPAIVATPRDLSAGAVPRLDTLSRQTGFDAFERALPRLEAASAAYARAALTRLGTVARDAVGPRYERLLNRLAEATREQPDPGTDLADPDAALAGLARAFPGFAAEIELVRRCGPRLGEVLSGRVDPVALLFGDDASDVLRRLYCDSPSARTHNTLLRDLLTRAVTDQPARRRVRILEVGAGTGGTTGYLLPALDPTRTEYVFTDVSPVLVDRARERFSTHPFVRYAVLDLERDPLGQGFAPGSFDVVVAANVLHATRDIRQSLRHLRSLLAPRGLLLALEGSRPMLWVDVTFGLTDGWWRFDDAPLRERYPLLSPDSWLRVLADSGFHDAHAIHANGHAKPLQTILVAAADERPAADSLAPAAENRATPESRQAPREPDSTGEPGAVASDRRANHRLILIPDRAGFADRVAAAVRDRGGHATILTPNASNAPVPGSGVQTGALANDSATMPSNATGGPPNVFGALQGMLRAPGTPTTVVDLRPLDVAGQSPGRDTGASAKSSDDLLWESLEAIQLVARSQTDVQLCFVTCGAQAVGGEPPGSQSPDAAAVWGLARVAAIEHATHRFRLLDLDPAALPDERAAVVAAEIVSNATDPATGEDQVAYREGKRRVPRLVRLTPSRHGRLRLHQDATYLLTGGLGGLGLRVASWLAGRGAGHLVLLGRSGLPPREEWDRIGTEDRATAERIAAVRALEARGTEVTVVAADVSQPAELADALRPVLDQATARGQPLRGVLHLAVAMSSAALADMDADTLLAMARAKIDGTRALHDLSLGNELDFFVLFSSTTSLLGAKGLGHYAAANQFLDAFAHYRRGLGLPATVVNWGTWDEMRIATDSDRWRFQTGGLLPMPATRALAALEWAITSGRVQTAVAAVNWSALKALYGARRRVPLLERVETEGPVATPGARTAGAIPDRVAGLPSDERLEFLVDWVRGHAAAVLGAGDVASIEIDRGLFELGMDSLMSVELKNRLEKGFGQRLPSTLTFNYPTVNAIAAFLDQKLAAPPVTAANGEPIGGRHAGAPTAPAVEHPADSQAESSGPATGRPGSVGDDVDRASEPAPAGAWDHLSEAELAALLEQRLAGHE